MRVVLPPHQADRDGRRVAHRPVDHTRPGILRHSGFGSDADVAAIRHPPTVTALACGGAAGILSSTVPLLVDLLALRRVPAHSFGIFMSVNPVLAAVVGLVILGQSLPWSG
jgi:drug/metabolite transporter (DMT)-like permease